jgi:hypothetical protein
MLLALIDERGAGLREHAEGVALLAELTAERLGLGEDEIIAPGSPPSSTTSARTQSPTGSSRSRAASTRPSSGRSSGTRAAPLRRHAV